MSEDQQEEAKRQLHKLLREYNANVGMAGFVCGVPVECMPESEQNRLIKGFCSKDNLQILATSMKKLERARNLELDESEAEKVTVAIATLEGLIEVFTAFIDGSIDVTHLRNKVRMLVQRPIPTSKDDLIDSLSHMIETLEFLATQNIATKDEWDTLMDCAQMHDALARTTKIGEALLICTGLAGQALESTGAIGETVLLADRQREFLESFFKGEVNSALLADQFKQLSDALHAIWSDPVS